MAELFTIVTSPSRVRSAAPRPAQTLGGQVDDDRIRDFVDGEYARSWRRSPSCAAASRPPRTRCRRPWPARGSGSTAATASTASRRGSRRSRSTWPAARCGAGGRNAGAATGSDRCRDDLSDAPAASGDAHAVREALRALPRRQREVTVLRYYLGLDVREIAAHLGIAEGTVKAMLFRARQSLAVAARRRRRLEREEVDRAHG